MKGDTYTCEHCGKQHDNEFSLTCEDCDNLRMDGELHECGYCMTFYTDECEVCGRTDGE